MSMRKLTEWSWLPLWLAMTAIALWARPAIPIDETRYLSVAWEMWTSGNFLVPHSNGLPYSHKPPLFFWLIHLGWWLFGEQEWSARLTGPLCGLLAIFLGRSLAGRLFPDQPEIQRRTPFLFLALISWSILASLTMFDTLMTSTALAALFILRGAATGTGKRWWLWLGLAMGLGILAKGPIIYIYVLPAVLVAPWWAESLPVPRLRWYGQSLLAIGVSLIVALSWALPAAWQGGHEYAQLILFGQTAGRMVQSFAHREPFYWYILILPLMFFPLSCYLPIWKGFVLPLRHNGNRFLLSILVPGILLLSFISGKQFHYLLPLLPAAVILLAQSTLRLPQMKKMDRYIFYPLCGVIGLAVAIAPFLRLGDNSAMFISLLPPWLGVVPLVAALPFLIARHGQARLTVPRIALSSILLFMALHLALAKTLHTDFDAPEVFRAMSDMDRKKRIIHVYPWKLKDQFAFSAQLNAPVVPLRSLKELTAAVEKIPEGVFVYRIGNDPLPPLPESALAGGAVANRYQSGWLVLLPAKMSNKKDQLAEIQRRIEKSNKKG